MTIWRHLGAHSLVYSESGAGDGGEIEEEFARLVERQQLDLDDFLGGDPQPLARRQQPLDVWEVLLPHGEESCDLVDNLLSIVVNQQRTSSTQQGSSDAIDGVAQARYRAQWHVEHGTHDAENIGGAASLGEVAEPGSAWVDGGVRRVDGGFLRQPCLSGAAGAHKREDACGARQLCADRFALLDASRRCSQVGGGRGLTGHDGHQRRAVRQRLEEVPHSVHRDYVAGMGSVSLDLCPQALQRRVRGSRDDMGAAAPDPLAQLLARDVTAWVAGGVRQELVLLRCERAVPTVPAHDATGEVHGPHLEP